ncbi:MAG: VWA domain-containing protein [Pirellulales bacterium]
MFDYHLSFGSPGYLALLAVVPLLWWASYRSLSGLGRWRRPMAIGFRSVILVLLILAAAEMQLVRSSHRLTVIYLLDQSLSIPADRRKAMIEYVNEAIREHRRQDDRAGVIVFGRDASIEIPPFDDAVQISSPIESLLDPEYTNLAGAMKLAQASFPEDAAKRIVILSDGNQNVGNALEQAQGLAAAGIGIDVLPIQYRARAEVAVEKVTIPSDVRRGQPFDLNVILNNTTEPSARDAGVVKGRLVVTQKTNDQPVVLSDQAVELPPGKRVFTVRQQIDQPDFYTYEARFVPDRPEDDAIPQNNRASTFTQVRGRGQVLLIEDAQNRGEFDRLVEGLRRENLQVAVETTDQLFTTLAELQRFDTVLLANVPRERFSDDQIQILARNTQTMGSGLVMLGGPSSFGAGGWTNTAVEEAMPVDFQIKSAKVIPKGALALLMHASEMPEGNYWQKVIAQQAIKTLGNEDYCGLIYYNGTDQWLWGGGMAKVGGNRQRMLGLTDRMVPGDMLHFDPAMWMAQRGFLAVPNAAVKHMIIISDGDPTPPSAGVVKALMDLKVTISTVAIGAHGPAESALLQSIATRTGGKYYQVKNPQALPSIYQREARRVARPLIYENKNGVVPRLKVRHEMVRGIAAAPPVTGFVMTTVKESSLVEVSLLSPLPVEERNSTILASWTYGLGKSVAFTSDAGARWATDWPGWPNYDKLFSQMVRWSMRPVGDTGKFTVATEVEDGQARIVITALDKNDEFINFLAMNGTAVGPGMKPLDVKIRQTAPGRYVGAFDVPDSGTYHLTILPGANQAPILTGVSVPYSAEFRDREPDEALLTGLASLAPKGGAAGTVIRDSGGRDAIKEWLRVDSFRHDLPKATSSQDIWPYLVFLGACLFFGDVFVRRVTVDLAWLLPLAAQARDWVLRRPGMPVASEYMDRLRNRKAEVSERLQQKQTAARFEPEADAPVDAAVLETGSAPAQKPKKSTQPAGGAMAPEKPKEEESYTARLLKAKQKVWEEKKKGTGSEPKKG